MTKIFVSYFSTDAAQVEKIVNRLAKSQDNDGSLRYTIWQYKDILAGTDWWKSILDAIDDCQIFVFYMSKKAVKSDICMTELRYANQRNFPIIPVILQDEYLYEEIIARHEINHWQELPTEMKDARTEPLYYEGESFFSKFDQAVANFLNKPQTLLPYQRPLDPRPDSSFNASPIELYSQAYDYAYRLDFATARSLFQKLINRKDADFYEESLGWINILHHYTQLVERDLEESTRHKLADLWKAYQLIFPKFFIAGIFDPKGFAKRFKASTHTISSSQILSIQNHIAQAEEYSKTGDYQYAIINYNYALRLDPDNANIYTHRAVIHTQRRDYDLALNDFSEAILLDSQNATLYNNRGYLYQHSKKDWERAVSDYDKAIELNPMESAIYSNRGWAYIEKQDYSRAIEDLNRAIQLNPQSATAYNNRGWAYIEKKEVDQAINDLNMAIQLNPRMAMAYNNLGWAHNEQKNYDQAIIDLTKAIQLDSKLIHAYANRGNSHHFKQDYDLAIADYTEAIHINPLYIIAYTSRGNSYYRKEAYEKAIPDYATALGFSVNPITETNLQNAIQAFMRQQE